MEEYAKTIAWIWRMNSSGAVSDKQSQLILILILCIKNIRNILAAITASRQTSGCSLTDCPDPFQPVECILIRALECTTKILNTNRTLEIRRTISLYLPMLTANVG